VTTFYSVHAPETGTLSVTTDGRVWVAGTYGSSVTVGPGWREVMIQAGTHCSISIPGGQSVSEHWNASSPLVSSFPIEGALSGTSFTFYIPHGGGPHRLLLTSEGGFDNVAI
jgi:hypothetical protein